ncbi:hypothetical protein D187_004138 [Cystobacter fuscus DSM 2262]|uniref:Uncharacterized protein n=1 Tax=Cystobacter fuscus (strain ATCC 25194 / DSM 2262 / NBRC 100088 / M29) TaxID=1242864 RepID=S9P820_CYSF2|nr:hypothetical protein D187_004138 [Cystobacter fuscus DSM 2262]
MLVSGGAALAQPQRRQLGSYQDSEMTLEERNAARARPKSNINAYTKDIKVKEEPIPWKAIGLAVIAFAVTAPFAWRAYKGTTRDIAAANTFGTSSTRGGEDASEQ